MKEGLAELAALIDPVEVHFLWRPAQPAQGPRRPL